MGNLFYKLNSSARNPSALVCGGCHFTFVKEGYAKPCRKPKGVLALSHNILLLSTLLDINIINFSHKVARPPQEVMLITNPSIKINLPAKIKLAIKFKIDEILFY